MTSFREPFHWVLQIVESEESFYLVVVAIGDGIGLNASFLHLEEDPDSQDWLAVLSTQLQQHTVTNLGQTAGLSVNERKKKLKPNNLIHTNIVNFSKCWYFPHLIWSLQLLVLHLPQHIVSCAQRPNLGVAATDEARQADEPQAVAVTQQTLGPHLRHRRVSLCHPLGCFDLLC